MSEARAVVRVEPFDEHNQQLVDNVHPHEWKNPEPAGRYHLVVIGAGTAGLISAAGAAGLGARVALIESRLLGGDCLNVGCVPSKGVISRLIIKRGSDKILGATLVAAHAGDMLGELCLAVTHGIGLGKIAATIHPYPTQAEVVKKAADTWRRTKLTPGVQKRFSLWFRLFS